MNEQSPICQECPARNACPLQIRTEKLAIGILFEGISDNDARGQLSSLKEVANIYNCPIEEIRRLVVPLSNRIIPNRAEINVPRGQTTAADLHAVEKIIYLRNQAFKQNRKGPKLPGN